MYDYVTKNYTPLGGEGLENLYVRNDYLNEARSKLAVSDGKDGRR